MWAYAFVLCAHSTQNTQKFEPKAKPRKFKLQPQPKTNSVNYLYHCLKYKKPNLV